MVPEVPIYIGGLSTKLTEITDRLTRGEPSLLERKTRLHALRPGSLCGQAAPAPHLRALQRHDDRADALEPARPPNPERPQARRSFSSATPIPNPPPASSSPPNPATPCNSAAAPSPSRCAARWSSFPFPATPRAKASCAYINRVRPKNVFLVARRRPRAALVPRVAPARPPGNPRDHPRARRAGRAAVGDARAAWKAVAVEVCLLTDPFRRLA